MKRKLQSRQGDLDGPVPVRGLAGSDRFAGRLPRWRFWGSYHSGKRQSDFVFLRTDRTGLKRSPAEPRLAAHPPQVVEGKAARDSEPVQGEVL